MLLRRNAWCSHKMRGEHVALPAVRLVAQGHARLRPRAAQLGQQCHLLAGMTREGMGACVAVEGPTTKVIFETYVQERRR